MHQYGPCGKRLPADGTCYHKFNSLCEECCDICPTDKRKACPDICSYVVDKWMDDEDDPGFEVWLAMR